MASSSLSAKLCFNSNCKQVLEQSRKGWRRRTGEYADLCDRCASAYEEGKFCESFHLNASGWRCCESCGKQIHCGCIVSFHMFVLLDAGGIECITCTRKSFILTPNPAWPPPSLVLPGLPDRIKDISVKNWSSIAASGPVPWRQAPSLFNSEMHPKMPFELDIPGGIDRLLASERLSATSLDKKKNEDSSERLINGSLKTDASQIFEKGIKCEEQPNPFVNATLQSAFGNNEPSTPHFSLTLNPALKTETTEQTKVSKTHAQRPTPPPAAGKQFCSSNGVDSSGEPQTRNGRPRGDARGRNQLLPRYWPRITDQELQQISGEYSNSIITPLFEKMLSASDAGRIGRLVLPKKCAEAYFPPISNPEGIPLMVQDLKGKEWVFQFRFWPNNNSRMYVLEGVTPCIQSMQMQAGDRVTFSRLEPEGKLVMGCRKAFTPSEQCKELLNTSNGGSTHGDAIIKATKAGEVVSVYRHSKGNPAASSLSAVNQANSADPASTWSKIDKSNYIAREALGAKPVLRSKRKYSTLASKSKRLRIENEMIELKVTREQAQGLFRPPPNDVPKIVMIEGYEIEEFEEPPIIGRPTILAEDHVGEKIQWAQCDDCLKWRKVPGDVLFPSRWTCSKNLWDPERSLCSAAQELSPEELKDLLSTSNQAGAKKTEADNEELDSLEALEGLDALAYLAIQEEGDALPSSSLATTKHPRHRPGCSCIVCIQPPSGKGPKHKPTCTCNVCLTVKRRFQTLTLRREKKQSEKEAETARQKLQQPEQLADEKIQPCSDTGNSSPSHKMVINVSRVDDPINMKSSTSPFKGQIDLNIQPERDEDLSPVSDSGDIRRVLQYATKRYFNKLVKFSSSAGNPTSAGSQMHPSGVGVGNLSNVIPLDSSKNGDSDHPLALSATKS